MRAEGLIPAVLGNACVRLVDSLRRTHSPDTLDRGSFVEADIPASDGCITLQTGLSYADAVVRIKIRYQTLVIQINARALVRNIAWNSRNFLLPTHASLCPKQVFFRPVNKQLGLQTPKAEAMETQYQKYYTMHSLASCSHRLRTPPDLLTDRGLRGE